MGKNNKGFTLVELLVGVVILVIITVPLLHTFVAGARTEHEAHLLGEATNAAQNLSEQMQAQDADFVLSNSAVVSRGAKYYQSDGSAYTAFGTKAPDISALPKTYYIGIPNYTYGDTSFDALITLTVPDDAVNSNEVIIGNEMDALINMTQADSDAVLKLKADFGDLVADADTLTSDMLTRSIILTVTKTIDAATDTYKVDAEFKYTASIGYYDTKNNYLTYPFDCTESSTATVASVADRSDGTPAFSVFMFYDAYYKNENIAETLMINNATGSDVKFFVVNTDTDTFTYAYSELFWYKYQNFDKTDNPINNLVYTNLLSNPSINVTYRASKNEVYRKTLPVTEYLVETKALNRKFDVKVTLYSAGSGFTGTTLAEISSTKINY